MHRKPQTFGAVICVVASFIALVWAIIFALWKLTHSEQFLAGWGAYVTGLATIALVIAALIAALTAIRELEEKRNFERGKWLAELYKSHYEEVKFKNIRRKIDYNDLDDIRSLIIRDTADENNQVPRQSPFTNEEKILLDEFTDYFNFFELIGYLCELRVVTEADVGVLFAYYLNRLIQVDPDSLIRRYLKQQGFHRLFDLLNVVSKRK